MSAAVKPSPDIASNRTTLGAAAALGAGVGAGVALGLVLVSRTLKLKPALKSRRGRIERRIGH